MCGRFNLRTPASYLVRFFDLLRSPPVQPRFNIAPTQPTLVVRQVDGSRVGELMHWGLIPSWSKDPKIGSRMINARGETVAEKPSFRAAFKRRRCLIPTTGFYEWKKMGAKTKQPYHIGMQDDEPFAFAGLWEHWQGADGSAIDSCTIITTSASSMLSDLHERMPVILDAADYDRWLDQTNEDKDELQSLLVPYDDEEAMKFYPVSTIVNSPRNDNAECVEEIELG